MNSIHTLTKPSDYPVDSYLWILKIVLWFNVFDTPPEELQTCITDKRLHLTSVEIELQLLGQCMAWHVPRFHFRKLTHSLQTSKSIIHRGHSVEWSALICITHVHRLISIKSKIHQMIPSHHQWLIGQRTSAATKIKLVQLTISIDKFQMWNERGAAALFPTFCRRNCEQKSIEKYYQRKFHFLFHHIRVSFHIRSSQFSSSRSLAHEIHHRLTHAHT